MQLFYWFWHIIKFNINLVNKIVFQILEARTTFEMITNNWKTMFNVALKCKLCAKYKKLNTNNWW
jgi:hypothetical protein